MSKRFLAIAATAISLFLGGCGTTKMPFADDAGAAVASDKPVYLMTATLRNDYKPAYQPKVMDLIIEKKGSKETGDIFFVRTDAKSKVEDDTAEKGNSYFMRMELENGDYVFKSMNGFSLGFMVAGAFSVPMNSPLKSSGVGGVYYLGHVQAVVRESKPGEFKAGPPAPNISQIPTGYGNGTFDVEISDQSDKDIPAFQSKFPALKNVTIQKAILPSFDRALAQKIWDKR